MGPNLLSRYDRRTVSFGQQCYGIVTQGFNVLRAVLQVMWSFEQLVGFALQQFKRRKDECEKLVGELGLTR